ncbi:MAG: TrbJ/VirB5 family protein [Caulobacteraceae bacterium]
MRSFKPARASAAVAALTAMGAFSSHAHAQMAVVDPSEIVQVVKLVSSAQSQLSALQSQLTNQQRMLSSIGSNSTTTLPTIAAALTSILNSAAGIGYTSSSVATQYTSAYPNAPAINGMSPSTISSALTAWHTTTSQSMQTALQTQQQVAQSQAANTAAAQGALTASQGASGQKAAVQATNQLLATVSAQLNQLESILITQARASELLATQQQSDNGVGFAAAHAAAAAVNDAQAPSTGVTNTNSL